jgi:transposase
VVIPGAGAQCPWGRADARGAVASAYAGGAPAAAHPAGIDAPVQYGARIAAVVVYLFVGQFLSRQRTAQALAELFGTPLSAGTVAAFTTRAAGGLREFLTVVRGRLAAAQVVGFDETGLRVAGELHRVHCARTDKYTLVICHRERGTVGIDDLGVLGHFRGVAVQDACAPYDTYLAPERQLCCAHARRELQAVADSFPADQWCWATQAGDALVAMQHLVRDADRAGHDRLDERLLAEQVARFRSAVMIGIEQTAARTGTLMKSTTPWPAACTNARTTTYASPPTGGSRPTTTDPNATSAGSN